MDVLAYSEIVDSTCLHLVNLATPMNKMEYREVEMNEQSIVSRTKFLF